MWFAVIDGIEVVRLTVAPRLVPVVRRIKVCCHNVVHRCSRRYECRQNLTRNETRSVHASRDLRQMGLT